MLEKNDKTHMWTLYADGRIVIMTQMKSIAVDVMRQIKNGTWHFDPKAKGMDS